VLDHIGVAVSDIQKSRKFYEAALKPLGIAVRTEVTPDQTGNGSTALGFGHEGDQGFFWVGDDGKVGKGTHIALAADRREQVDAFYEAAIAAGGRDNGEPGPRPHYGPNYYAAFVCDPDGINFEVVCNKPQ
jgi:catechol 2,3-dioxygenase-like lactoylglutathione lyase family enzyme